VLLSGGDLLETGTPAPPFELTAVDSGRHVSLEGAPRHGGGARLLVDDLPTLPPADPGSGGSHERLGPEGLVILGVNAEGAAPDAVRQFARDRGIGYQMLVDPGHVGRAYRVERLPTLYVIDRAGDVRWSHEGYTPAAISPRSSGSCSDGAASSRPQDFSKRQ